MVKSAYFSSKYGVQPLHLEIQHPLLAPMVSTLSCKYPHADTYVYIVKENIVKGELFLSKFFRLNIYEMIL